MRQLLESLEVTERLGILSTISLVRSLKKKEMHERLRASGDDRTAWDITYSAVRRWLAADYYAHSPQAATVRQQLTADELARLEAACGDDMRRAALRMCSGNLASVHLTRGLRKGAARQHGGGFSCRGSCLLCFPLPPSPARPPHVLVPGPI